MKTATYTRPVPCVNGHGPRPTYYLSSHRCVHCAKEESARQTIAKRTERLEDIEAKAEAWALVLEAELTNMVRRHNRLLALVIGKKIPRLVLVKETFLSGDPVAAELAAAELMKRAA